MMDKVSKYIIARWAYAIGKDYISDVEYDHLEEELKREGLAKEFISRGWSEDPCPYALLKEYNLDEFIVPVIYTHKTESIQSLNSNDVVRSTLGSLNENSRLSYKLDGFNLRLNYYNGKFVSAQTRNRNEGNAKDLISISDIFLKEIPIKGKVLVIGELYIKNDKFEDYKKMRGIVSQRNGVSTAIANGDSNVLGYRCYSVYGDEVDSSITDKYDYLDRLGFPVADFVEVKDYGSLLSGIKILGRKKSMLDCPTDGLVLENSKMQYALRVGAWQEEINYSYVTGYTMNRGAYGNNILVTIKPVFVNQKTISEIDIDNIQNIIDNNLQVGYPIVFVERSAVNSVIDSTKTSELQDAWADRYDEFRKMVDEKYRKD